MTEKDYYYCFVISNKQDLIYTVNYDKISKDRENYKLCIARENYHEILEAVALDRCIFYNKDKRVFTDYNFNQISIEGKNIFPRCSATVANEMLEDIEKNNGISISTKQDNDKVENWLEYYKPQRKILKMSIGEYEESYIQIFKELAGESKKLFIKSVKKGFSIVLKGLYDDDTLGNKSSKMEIYISEYIDISKDELGKKEFRCYIVDGKLTSISRYLDYNEHEIPEDVRQKALQIVSNIPKEFPSSYVLDLGVYNKNNTSIDIDVIEFNPIISSGKYIYNTIFTNRAKVKSENVFEKYRYENLSEDDKQWMREKAERSIEDRISMLSNIKSIDELKAKLFGNAFNDKTIW